LKRILNALWAVFAALAIGTAVLVSAARLWLPSLDQQPERIAEWASSRLGVELTLGSIEARWRGWSPTIELRNIIVPDKSGQQPALKLDRAAIRIRPIASLLRAEPTPSTLSLSGIALTIERLEDGTLRLLGGSGRQRAGTNEALARWMLAREDLRIEGATLAFVDRASGDAPVVLRDANIDLHKNASGHDVRIALRPPPEFGERLEIKAALRGQVFSGSWQALVRIEGSAIEIARFPWRQYLANASLAGAMSFRIDSRWQDGRLSSAVGDFRGRQLDLSAAQALHFDALAGSLSLSRQADGAYYLTLRGLDARTGEYQWPGDRLDVVWKRASGELETLVAAADAVRLEDIAPLLTVQRDLPDRVRHSLDRARPRGVVRNLELAYFAGGGQTPLFRFGADLDRVGFIAFESFPALTGLSGRLVANSSGGSFAVAPHPITFESDGHLIADIVVEPSAATAVWRRAGAAWKLRVPRSDWRAASIDMTVAAEALLRESAPYVDLSVAIHGGDAGRLHHFLPKDLLKPSGEEWARRAFASGRLTESAVTLRGPLDRFPFDQHEGVFEVRMGVEDAILEYSKRWPRAEELAGDVVVQGRRVSAKIASGRVYGAEIRDVDVRLDDLFGKDRTLTVSGRAQGTGKDALAVVADSPLRNGKTARMMDVDVQGDLDLTLDLSIPLKRDGKPDVLGELRFERARIASKTDELALTDIEGALSFTREDWYGEDIRATYDGYAVSVITTGGLDDPNYRTEFVMTGRSDAQYVLDTLQKRARPVYEWLSRSRKSNWVNGELGWRAILTLPDPVSDGPPLPKRLQLESSLQGLKIDLPSPIGKSAREERLLVIASEFGPDIPERRYRIRYGELLQTEVLARRTEVGSSRVERIEVVFGDRDAVFTDAPGVSVRGHLAELPLGEWLGLLQREAGSGTAASTPASPVNVNVSTDELSMLGHRFANAAIAGGNAAGAWAFTARGEQLDGDIKLSADFKELNANLARLYFGVAEPDKLLVPVDPRTLPALYLDCADFRFGANSLGAAKLEAVPGPEGLRLASLTFRRGGYAITASGNWTYDGTVHMSRFDITATSDDLEELLTSFGYQSGGIEGGDTRLDIHAQWGGMPSDFALSRLEGNLSMTIKDGSLTEVEPGSGRLFGLLSLNSLGRRLTLDFEDLFSKGLSFDTISGGFQLENGNAYTNNLTLRGPAAHVDIVGRTGLSTQDYDQRVTVTPEVASTIPVAGALFGPAGVGIGAVLFLGQKIFKSIPDKFDSILKREYTVTGSWDEPVVERIRYAQSEQ
jgi:uncharacterized protein (TIGR02099 family)